MTQLVPCHQYDNDETLRFQHLRNRIENAWKCFYEKAYNMIVPKLKYKHQIDTENIKDIFQKKMEDLIKQIDSGQFDSPDNRKALFTTILLTYCENGIRDHFRSRRVKSTIDLDISLIDEKTRNRQNDGEYSLFIQGIQRELAEFSKRDQKIIQMIIFLGMDYKGISEELKIPIENLRKYYNKAIKKLRDKLR